MKEIQVEQMKINDVVYLRESDVNQFYTRKDNVEVDRMVLEQALLKMDPAELTTLLTSIAEKKLKTVGYSELSDMMNPESYDDFVLGKLLMIANVGRV